MRRFRFVGNPKPYKWKIKPIVNEVYDWARFMESNGKLEDSDKYVFDSLNEEEDWQEVSEQKSGWAKVDITDMNEKLADEPKTLHKDTDLGMFTLGIINGTISNQLMVDSMSDQSRQFLVENAILLAKELIKQLDSLHDTASNHNE